MGRQCDVRQCDIEEGTMLVIMRNLETWRLCYSSSLYPEHPPKTACIATACYLRRTFWLPDLICQGFSLNELTTVTQSCDTKETRVWTSIGHICLGLSASKQLRVEPIMPLSNVNIWDVISHLTNDSWIITTKPLTPLNGWILKSSKQKEPYPSPPESGMKVPTGRLKSIWRDAWRCQTHTL